jgi:hypothetical protein
MRFLVTIDASLEQVTNHQALPCLQPASSRNAFFNHLRRGQLRRGLCVHGQGGKKNTASRVNKVWRNIDGKLLRRFSGEENPSEILPRLRRLTLPIITSKWLPVFNILP